MLASLVSSLKVLPLDFLLYDQITLPTTKRPKNLNNLWRKLVI